MTDYTELRRLAEAAQYENCEFQHELVAATKAFFVGCIPEQILALIAENERMSTNCLGVKLDVFEIVCAERDQLKAENERLSTENSEIESAAITYIEDMQEAQRENARLTELFTVGMTLDGNLRVYGDWQSVRKAQEILAERDQLRAEVAGLKTGYEAYERVNAELKVECGALCDELKNLRSDKAQLIYALKQEEQNYLALRTERDRFKTDNEALRDDVEQNQYDANAWRNSEESVWIEVFNSEGDDPFISAITGQITVEQLALIQAEILEYREDYFEKGSGLYVFRCAHYQAHHDNVGMTEPAHWETDFESYSPFPWEEEAAAMGQGEQS